MDQLLSPAEERNQKAGKITSTIFHIIIIALLFLPFFTYPDPPPGQEGVLVSLGQPEVGMNDTPADAAAEPETAEEVADEPIEETITEPVEEVVEEEPEPVVEEPKVEPKKEDTKAADDKKIREDKASKELALKREKEKKKREEAAKEAKKKADAEARAKKEAARKAKLAEEARKKAAREKAERAAAEAKRRADAKKKAEGLFNTGGSGSGTGNGGSTGNQGQTDGDPNGTALEGLGVGSVGGKLRGRGGKGPSFDPAVQVQGKITIKVCVDANGRVKPESVRKTLSNTTITNQTVIRQAEKAAKKWKFKAGDEACGTVTYVIKLK
ncbi:MAG: hypothetical protein P8M17_03505 [Saprospiraceae bacterium]|jgi:TolA protein|nr:hypothetical protein [Saprospiraceae bacterium]